MVWIFCKISLPFFFDLFQVENVPGYIIFQMFTQIFMVTSPPIHCLPFACGHTSYHTTHVMHVIMLPSSMLPTQFTWHFCWGTCFLFTLGSKCTSYSVSDFLLACCPFNLCGISALFTLDNRHISCYTTHAIYVVCQRNLQVNIQYLHATYAFTTIKICSPLCAYLLM